MADTTFVNGSTVVQAAWLNDVNDDVYTRANVKRFGAVGDGVTDDTAAFVAAFADNNSIYAPGGTYKVELTLASYQKIIGEGIGNTILIPTGNNKTVLTFLATSTPALACNFCSLRDLSIRNPNSNSGCNGIWFKGDDVYSINDDHSLSNLYIHGMAVGVKVTGRLIDTEWTKVHVIACTRGMTVTTDPVNIAFIFNNFRNCVWNDCLLEGMRIEEISVCNRFDTCNWQSNNKNLVAGTAAAYVADGRSLSFDNCYWENNGYTMSADTAVPLNNTIDLYLTGTNITQRVTIDNSYFFGAGVCIYTDAEPSYGCSVANSLLAPGANGSINPAAFSLVSTTPQSGYQEFFTILPGNTINGVVQVVGTDSLYPVSAVQNPGMAYASVNGTQPTINLLNYANWSIHNNNVALPINAISNRIPGLKFNVWNSAGTAAITINAALMANGQACTIPAGGYASFEVATFPQAGKLIEVSGFVGAASATYDPPSLADGAGATTTVSVPGAALGDFAQASFSLTTSGITITAWVSTTDTVSVRFQNESGGTLDIGSGTLKVKVTK